jgi:hypothetical protein
MLVEPCSAGDFTTILEQLPEFWGDDRTRALHHPMFIMSSAIPPSSSATRAVLSPI